jgi:hypothetical protein
LGTIITEGEIQFHSHIIIRPCASWVAASRNGKILTKKYRDGKKKMPQGERGRDCFLEEEPILSNPLRSAAALNLKPQ